jgi:hypothetical protein
MRGQTGGALASPVLMLLVTALLLSSKTAAAQNMPPPMPPDVVKLPAGTNLGAVSFYDAVGNTDPGLTVQGAMKSISARQDKTWRPPTITGLA